MNPHAPWYRYWERPSAESREEPVDEPARAQGAADARHEPRGEGGTPVDVDADGVTAAEAGPRELGSTADERAQAGQGAQPDRAGAGGVPTGAVGAPTGAGSVPTGAVGGLPGVVGGRAEGHGLASGVAAEPDEHRGDEVGDGDLGVHDAPPGGGGEEGLAAPAAGAEEDSTFHVEPQARASAAGRDTAVTGEAPFHVEPQAEATAEDSAEAGPGASSPLPAPLPIEPDALGLAARPPQAEGPAGHDDATSGGERPARAGPVAPGSLFARARVLTIANQKGGVGKTTTAVSVSAALADLGCRVLLVDLDPQGNATSGVGVRVPPDRPTIYDVLVGDVDLEDAIEPTSVRNLFVVPSNLDLAGAEIELVSAFNREQKLRRALEPIRAEYDVVLIDCPPSLGLLTVNALSAGDGLVVPIQCEYYALEGLGALRRNADLIRSQLNPDLDITGFVLTMLDARTRLSQQVVDEVRTHFGNRVFTTRIPRSVRLAEAPGFGQPITVFDPSSRGALAYRRLAAELLDRLMTNDGPPPPERRAEGAPV